MGSLNGDVVVMRNGRSTSQVSVYNYPEHLNPFYEDDQHKRLRFWKINKKDNEGRRNSFSIGNLKDMWAFKSFRLKKKSSTLGINKTSESPPTLRRDCVIDNGWNTFDHRLRDSNTSSINGDNFQRNATYRSSLQTLPTNTDRFGLNRNDGYRSTIQVTRSNPRYQPQQKQQQKQQQKLPTTGVSQSRRSSQSSLVSTNPFESDDEDEDINTSGMKSVNGSSTTTLTSRTPRKKRRAPAPPTPIHGRSNGATPPTIHIESSQDFAEDELRIKEDMDIASLTAEIESFVKTKSNDDVEIAVHDDVNTTTTTSINTSTNNVEKVIMENTLNEVNKEEKENGKTTATTGDTSKRTTNTIETNISTKGEVETKPASKTNGQVTTEIVTVTTTTKTAALSATEAAPAATAEDVSKRLETKSNVGKVTTTEIVTKTNENKEIKSNGAIPKKPINNNSAVDQHKQQHQQTINIVEDLCIKETIKEEMPNQKPVPLKRQTKPETEVGHVECIHVHVESPRATPRSEHSSGVSSFKTNESMEATTETITNKTPFILTSPPTQRRNAQQQQSETKPVRKIVKICETSMENGRISELNITEERINTKPEILAKPTLSPKPATEANSKIHAFAEIHKPLRSKITHNQNGHTPRASRDDSIPPPIVPIQTAKPKEGEEDKKINTTMAAPAAINDEKIVNVTKMKTEMETTMENVKKPEEQTIENLKIVETLTSNSGASNEEKIELDSEEINSARTVVTATDNKDMLKHDHVADNAMEADLIYRPNPATHMEWKRSTLAPLETNIPPEKRKSVKDIIESINRSQRLLHAAANKDFTLTTTMTTNSNNNNNFNENPKILDEREKEVQAANATNSDKTAVTANSPTLTPSPTPSNGNNEYSEAQKLDNNEIFQKCKVMKEVYDYRESSPISSNLDWNPVPKPKRTKSGPE